MLKNEFNALAKKNDWGVLEILHSSNKKKTVVAKISINTHEYVVKCCMSGAPDYVVEAFMNEKKYYSLFTELDITAGFIDAEDSVILLNYIDGDTIWQYSKLNDLSSVSAIKIAQQIVSGICEINSVQSLDKVNSSVIFVWKKALGRVKDLFFSGPKNTSCGFLVSLKLKVIFYLSLPILMPIFFVHVIRILNDKSCLGVRYHGDLHMNNLVLDKKNQVYFIDFECAAERSTMFLDFLYSYATFCVLSKCKDEVTEAFIEEFFKNREENSSIKFLMRVFLCAVMLNPKFSHESDNGSVLKFISSIFNWKG